MEALRLLTELTRVVSALTELATPLLAAEARLLPCPSSEVKSCEPGWAAAGLPAADGLASPPDESPLRVRVRDRLVLAEETTILARDLLEAAGYASDAAGLIRGRGTGCVSYAGDSPVILRDGDVFDVSLPSPLDERWHYSVDYHDRTCREAALTPREILRREGLDPDCNTLGERRAGMLLNHGGEYARRPLHVQGRHFLTDLSS